MQAIEMRWLRELRSDQRGLTTVEYVIVLCLIAVVAVATWSKFGTMVNTHLADSNTIIDKELTPP